MKIVKETARVNAYAQSQLHSAVAQRAYAATVSAYFETHSRYKIMFQVNFSEQSMHELNQLDTRSQMLLVEVVSTLKQEQLDNPNEELGRFHRNGKTYYRVRAGEFRIYFEQDGEALFAHYILHKNTLSDFIFRFKLPFAEEFMLEQEDSFWKYLESLRHKDEVDD
ncbi:cytotoxic translational repressor of toxin-antitoxin stability system [Coraliomargarita sp. SDUM461004]|uniref:Cytotoxic translational repressor of toxin-antitoxin stability system n=1 Tax=Thalassobacterium sedimentorum TaxID=3041258 RepID=A0ABU1AQK5_9BACT|nr:cytotoxic translational repressor of toxin-antitoxin stability system [Coraliomargarita sp. SDUM461004]MDQ8196041.1 cytotoxic translational repressor of toxin-antitoxin stability system [Coraliomargarita sp. SDUM461004]